MPTYVALVKWTDQGVKNAKGAVDRASQAHASYVRAGSPSGVLARALDKGSGSGA